MAADAESVDPDQVIADKTDIITLLITIVIPVAVISVAGWVMVDKSYWSGLGFFAVGIVFWFLIYYMHKTYFAAKRT